MEPDFIEQSAKNQFRPHRANRSIAQMLYQKSLHGLRLHPFNRFA